MAVYPIVVLDLDALIFYQDSVVMALLFDIIFIL